jgi:hypothetical protein
VLPGNHFHLLNTILLLPSNDNFFAAASITNNPVSKRSEIQPVWQSLKPLMLTVSSKRDPKNFTTMRFSFGKILVLALAADVAVASNWFSKAGKLIPSPLVSTLDYVPFQSIPTKTESI